ncbi:hypothetical protein BAUCODRAFT_29370 [Baudoinia panamericana UAMH 10762]|uniref:Uncharacterized protein n=1 Tax=Baudoinia panamericana (strain UAMH 10762) TaxID=717646 RepID=M2MVI7_BAUPA|nr:uncharacterized protein BAUCODRAFT_29370 [Baudoinia panamericana UAMH 10762]EMD00982.1 hypothetical protein BAUCODRAFT_29370 [Baudoinia panamericana UAMH 10762]
MHTCSFLHVSQATFLRVASSALKPPEQRSGRVVSGRPSFTTLKHNYVLYSSDQSIVLSACAILITSSSHSSTDKTD